MSRRIRVIWAILFLVPPTVCAANDLTLRDAWIAEAPPNANMLAGYVIIENAGRQAQTLIGVSSPAFSRVELHRSVTTDGMARMIPQDRVDIPPSSLTRFEPGGYHLMLIGPKRPLQAGDQVQIFLRFKDDKVLSTTAVVRKRVPSPRHESPHGSH